MTIVYKARLDRLELQSWIPGEMTAMPNSLARREFLKTIGFGAAAAALSPLGRAVAGEGAKARPNVLFIAVDDLRPELGCYGSRHIRTPNIDKLAKSARLFKRHYIQSAVCGPSRCSLLTGRRLWSWDCWKSARKLKTEPSAAVSFPHLFRRGGYRTVCIGKISHLPGGVTDPAQKRHEVPFSWDLSYAPIGKWKDPWGAFFCYADGSVREYGYGRNKTDTPAFECADVADEGYADGLNAREAIKQLGDLKSRGKPFLLAVGFYKPHLPHNAPKKYWDMYDPDKIPLAPNRQPPRNVDADISLHPSFELTGHYAWPGGKGKITDAQARNQRHAYFACVSYMDAQVGKVLGELKRLGLDRNTIVVLWGDHGWHLGEHGIFGKQTNFEIAARSPLIVRMPDMPRAGKSTDALAETVDIYPTLAELCGLKPPADLPGVSLKPLLDDPDRRGKDGAFSFFGRGRYFGRTLRTDRYRIVEWSDRRKKLPAKIELYDHRTDPGENTNIAGNAENKKLVQKLLAQMKTPSRAVATRLP